MVQMLYSLLIEIILSLIFVFLCAVLSLYFANSFRFFRFIDKTFYNYTQLIGLKTDWKHSFLEQVADGTRNFFHAPLIVIIRVTDNKAKVIAHSFYKHYGLLLDQINKKDFLVNVNRKFNFLPLIPSERGIFQDTKNRKQMGLKYSFTLPILNEKNKPEAFINIYCEHRFSFLFSAFSYILFCKRINYFFSGLLRNVYTDKEDLADVLLEHIEDYALISLNEKSEIVSWNKGAERLFGYRSIEIIGRMFSVLFHPDDTQSLVRCLEILTIKEEIKFFASLRDRMSITIKAELSVKKQLQDSGDIAGYRVFIKDITKEEIFKQNIQQYSFINYTILENSQDGILILDEHDKIIFYNQRVRTILDNPINLFGVPGKKIFPRHFGEEFDKSINALKKESCEFSDIDYMFEQHYYNIRFFRVHKNSKNEYGGAIIFFIDESLRMEAMMELEEKKEDLERINSNLLDALSSARVMQENLIPRSLPNDTKLSCAAIYELSDDIGGDFYYIDYFSCGEKEYAVAFVSDVSGHGIAASMMNVMVKDIFITIREEMEHGSCLTDPSLFLESLNKRLFDLNFLENKFITCFAAIIDFQEKKISLASAGHPLPYHIRGDRIELLKFKRAVPLGVLENLPSNISYTIPYQENDRFIFYTDGFLDIFEKQGKTPSEAVEEFLMENRKASLEEIKAFASRQNQLYRLENRLSSDDLTILFLELKS